MSKLPWKLERKRVNKQKPIYINCLCTIGTTLNEECHKVTLSIRKGVFVIRDLTHDQKAILEWRSGTSLIESNTLCYHHEKKFISRYEYLQKICCDPYKVHKKKLQSEY